MVFFFGLIIGKSNILNDFTTHIYRALNVSLEKPRKTYSYHKDKINLFNSLSNRNCEALFIGDSLIDNAEWQELLPKYKVINRGIQGIVTSDLLSLIQEIELIKSPTVFVMIGINDLRRGIKHQVIMANYTNLLNQLLEKYKYVFIHSVLLGSSDEKTLNQKIINLNNDLIKITEKNNRAKYIDLNFILSPEGYISDKLSFDGIHLNGKGYIKWGDVIKQQIVQTK